MLVLSTPSGALSARRCVVSSSAPLEFITKPTSNSCSLADPWPRIGPAARPRCCTNSRLNLTLAKADGSTRPSTSAQVPIERDETVLVGQENVPLEGVIQFEKPDSSFRLKKWGRIALLAGGDVLALLVFSAIGRFSHGFPVFSYETLSTADPFIAGWFLGAYFLGGYGEDGRGMNGRSKALTAAFKSWIVGVPVGIVIRSVSLGHIPPNNFILVSMGSTAALLIGWRALLYNIFPDESDRKDDVYKRGSPFELFELLASLVRRW